MTMTSIPLDQVHPDTLAAIAADLAEAGISLLPDAIVANARELDDLRSAKKVLEEREAVLRAAVLDFLTTEGVDSAPDGTVSVSRATHDRKGIDRAKMEALYPKVLAAVETTIPVTQLRGKIKG